MSDFDEILLIIYQNDALDVCFRNKIVARSHEVIRGHKSRIKTNFSIFLKNTQTIPQNETSSNVNK